MLLSRKAWYVMFGLIAIHAIILFSHFGKDIPNVSGVLWKEGEYLYLPHVVSRVWDLALIPAIFITFGLFKKIGWWSSDSWDGEEGSFLGHFFPFFVGCAIAFVFSNACGCGSEPGIGLLTLLKILTVGGIILWIIGFCASTVECGIYLAGLLWFTTGVFASFFGGLQYFLILSLPALLISLFAALMGMGILSEKFDAVKQRVGAWWEEKNAAKRIIRKALALDVTPQMKEKIRSSVEEISKLEKEIQALVAAKEILLTGLLDVKTKLTMAKDLAKVKGVNELAELVLERSVQLYTDQKVELLLLLSKCDNARAEKEAILAKIFAVLEHAKNVDWFCKEYDKFKTESGKTQDNVKVILEKIVSKLTD